jgi:L-ascorbate metabolism protein UlaG (beta-lactamase superfamily)
MRVRWLGHSCIEILGKNHVLIDPDYLRDPLPDVDYILITHGHEDHLGRVAEVPTGTVFAAMDVCEVGRELGVPARRLKAVKQGDVVDNVQVLPGYSSVGWLSELWARLWGRRHKFPGGTPLSFLVEDNPSTTPRQGSGQGSGHRLSLLHIGDGHKAPQGVKPDIFCLPYRRVPWRDEWYQQQLTALVEGLRPRYVIPIHHDIPPWEADPEELRGRLSSELVIPIGWVELTEGR